jgi:hypothetical protein
VALLRAESVHGAVAAFKKLFAALGGIAVAFVLVMLLSAMTPDPELHVGDGVATFDRFQFKEPSLMFTEGSRVMLHNEGAVPATFVITDPHGGNSSVLVDAGERTNVTVSLQGTYSVTTVEWFWAEQTWDVRSANPFVRFVEDLF